MKILSTLIFTLCLIFSSFDVSANHCSGGHKEIKDTSDTSTDKEKDSKSNWFLYRKAEIISAF